MFKVQAFFISGGSVVPGPNPHNLFIGSFGVITYMVIIFHNPWECPVVKRFHPLRLFCGHPCFSPFIGVFRQVSINLKLDYRFTIIRRQESKVYMP
jgi:hypothetical protein